MKLPSGLEIPNPRELILSFVRGWYPMYDGVPIEADNQLRVIEIALSTMLNSRISGNTASAIWLAREPIEAAMAMIPSDVDLLMVDHAQVIPGINGIIAAVDSMCAIHRVKLAVTTKILHKKRPALIPIFDSKVDDYYGVLVTENNHHGWGRYCASLIKKVHADMLAVRDELQELREELDAQGTPMTPCRILNALTWIVRSGTAQEFLENN